MISVFAVCFVVSTRGQSQTPAQLVAAKIADKMRDSLDLSNQEREDIYDKNIWLHTQKMLARANYGHDTLRIQMQLIENNRDTLYKGILSVEKYELYRQKKMHIVNNN